MSNNTLPKLSVFFALLRPFVGSVPPGFSRFTMEHVYILKLNNGKWYVGKSSKINARLRNHFKGKGSGWTSMYTPVTVHKVIEGSKDLENFITVKLMATYGIANVRGGNWTKPELSKRKEQIALSCILRYLSAAPHPLRFLHCGARTASLTWRLVHPLRDGDYKG